MSCEEVSVDNYPTIVEISCDATEVIETASAPVEIVEVGIPGPRGPAGEGVAYFWEPEAGESLLAGQAVNVSSAGLARLAAAADSSLPVVGLASEATLATMGARIQISGPITLDNWTDATGSATLTIGATYYLSATPGRITTTPPTGSGRSLQEIGRALAANKLFIAIINHGRRA